ncbi:hypothetical protein ACNKHO_22640 [Shigella flexneri]
MVTTPSVAEQVGHLMEMEAMQAPSKSPSYTKSVSCSITYIIYQLSPDKVR